MQLACPFTFFVALMCNEGSVGERVDKKIFLNWVLHFNATLEFIQSNFNVV